MDDLLPKPVSAQATYAGRWARTIGFVLTPRALWLLAGGLLLSVPAFFQPRLLWLMPAWDLLVLALAVVDAFLLPPCDGIQVERAFLNLPAVGSHAQVRVSIAQQARTRLRLRVMDSLHPTLVQTPVFRPLLVWRNDPAAIVVDCWPRLRGDLALGQTAIEADFGTGRTRMPAAVRLLSPEDALSDAMFF